MPASVKRTAAKYDPILAQALSRTFAFACTLHQPSRRQAARRIIMMRARVRTLPDSCVRSFPLTNQIFTLLYQITVQMACRWHREAESVKVQHADLVWMRAPTFHENLKAVPSDFDIEEPQEGRKGRQAINVGVQAGTG